MARRHYLISYDVSSDKRRTKVFNSLDDVGDHVQFSVFLCELTNKELAQLRSDLHPHVHEREDQLLILDLGPAHLSLEAAMEVIGRPHKPLVRTLII